MTKHAAETAVLDVTAARAAVDRPAREAAAADLAAQEGARQERQRVLGVYAAAVHAELKPAVALWATWNATKDPLAIERRLQRLGPELLAAVDRAKQNGVAVEGLTELAAKVRGLTDELAGPPVPALRLDAILGHLDAAAARARAFPGHRAEWIRFRREAAQLFAEMKKTSEAYEAWLTPPEETAR